MTALAQITDLLNRLPMDDEGRREADKLVAELQRDAATLEACRRIVLPNVAGVIERDAAWEELGMSLGQCDELYQLLRPTTPSGS